MNIFSNRHPTIDERKIIATLLEEVGPSEVLRVIGQWVCAMHDNTTFGNDIRSSLNFDAKLIDSNNNK